MDPTLQLDDVGDRKARRIARERGFQPMVALSCFPASSFAGALIVTRTDRYPGCQVMTVVRSSDNVFADLGLPDAEEKQTKVRLAVAINQIIDKMRLSQTAAAELLHINQPKISALGNYRLSGFSVERLIHFLNALGRDVEIVIRKPRSSRTGKIQVTAA